MSEGVDPSERTPGAMPAEETVLTMVREKWSSVEWVSGVGVEAGVWAFGRRRPGEMVGRLTPPPPGELVRPPPMVTDHRQEMIKHDVYRSTVTIALSIGSCSP